MFRVKEVSDLFVDACVRHPDTSALVFLSIFGRDTALLEFFASFSLPASSGGLSEFTLLDADGEPSTVCVPEPSRLDKLTGKLPKANLFGNLAHAWLFDPVIVAPNRANRTAWSLFPTRDGHDHAVSLDVIHDRLWQQVVELSPVPLSTEWRPAVMDLLEQGSFLTWLDSISTRHPPLGPVMACRISLGPRFVDEVSKRVRAGVLRASANALV